MTAAQDLDFEGPIPGDDDAPPDYLMGLDNPPSDPAPCAPVVQMRSGQGQISRMIQETLRALGESKGINLYQRAGSLVRVVREPKRREPYELDYRPSEDPTIAAHLGQHHDTRHGMSILMRPGTPRLDDAGPVLLEQIDRVSRWEKFVASRKKDAGEGDGKWVAVDPSPVIVGAIAKRKDYPGIRPLRGLLETPCLAPSGRIIQAAGYDEETAHVLLPSCNVGGLIVAPTRENARAALKYLWTETACDLPFRGLGEPARDGDRDLDPTREIQFKRALEFPDAFVGVAAVLSILARLAIEGACPGALFEAAGQGSGKSLQMHTTAMITTGRPAGVATFPMRDGRVNEEELEKMLAGYALGSARIVAFDNVKGTISGGTLEKTLTTPDNVDFRILGLTGQKSLEWLAFVMFSANNASMADDIAQRLMVSRLESPRENPRARPSSSFYRPDLLASIKKIRPRLVRAALVILRAFFTARDRGEDMPSCGSRGSFEQWAKIIPPALCYAGGPNVLAAFPEEGRGGDEEGEAHATLLRWWQSSWDGQRASAILDAMFRGEKDERDGGAPDGFSEARAAVRALTKTRENQPVSAQVFGIKLFGLRGKIREGLRIDAEKNKSTNVQTYKVTKVL